MLTFLCSWHPSVLFATSISKEVFTAQETLSSARAVVEGEVTRVTHQNQKNSFTCINTIYLFKVTRSWTPDVKPGDMLKIGLTFETIAIEVGQRQFIALMNISAEYTPLCDGVSDEVSKVSNFLMPMVNPVSIYQVIGAKGNKERYKSVSCHAHSYFLFFDKEFMDEDSSISQSDECREVNGIYQDLINRLEMSL